MLTQHVCVMDADREGFSAPARGVSAGIGPVFEEKGEGEILEGRRLSKALDWHLIGHEDASPTTT